jgi:hypothetical protein
MSPPLLFSKEKAMTRSEYHKFVKALEEGTLPLDRWKKMLTELRAERLLKVRSSRTSQKDLVVEVWLAQFDYPRTLGDKTLVISDNLVGLKK